MNKLSGGLGVTGLGWSTRCSGLRRESRGTGIAGGFVDETWGSALKGNSEGAVRGLEP